MPAAAIHQSAGSPRIASFYGRPRIRRRYPPFHSTKAVDDVVPMAASIATATKRRDDRRRRYGDRPLPPLDYLLLLLSVIVFSPVIVVVGPVQPIATPIT